ncbi:intraflagellar transport protein 81 homolog [Microplitis demolitor]|uniref:intraflagellar transport protein 81 homolog n=1 Tax=Microplitis demolitor TaxID=69319 RepID=UPI00235B689F|nr:intraflagellar transport protein 81 homolog [Microplitis demolitor]
MGEDLKQIITELNKLLNKNFSLISFKALSSVDLLQLLSDLLSKITETPKINIIEENVEQSTIRILSILKILKYQTNKDFSLFRQRLMKGDQDTIYSILQWLITNIDIACKRAYLSRFLIKIEVPAEYLQESETSALYERYLELVEEFKIVHKEREAGIKGNEAAAELKSDLRAMEKERQVLVDRIEKIKSKTTSQAHLLKIAQELRIEKDRDHELILQRMQENKAIESLQLSLQKAEQKLETLKKIDVELTPQSLQQRLQEEVMILTAIYNEKMAKELSALKLHVNALNNVTKTPYIGPDDIIKLRQQLDVLIREIKTLAENKVTENGSDKITPFRQQAAAIAGIKRNTLDKLEKNENDLAELSIKLENKRAKTKHLTEDSIPKGEDLKRYVARLKTKSGIYKRCRAELAELRAEGGILSRTNIILESKLTDSKTIDTINMMNYEYNIPDNFNESNARDINLQLTRNLLTLKSKLSSLLNDLKPLRQKNYDVEDKYERAKRSYDSIASSTQNAISNLMNDVEITRKLIENNTQEIKELEGKILKMKKIQKNIQNEFYSNPGNEKSLQEKLSESIIAEEKKYKLLKEKENTLKELVKQSVSQTHQWTNLIAIFKSKIDNYAENKRRDGIVLRKDGTETLILE